MNLNIFETSNRHFKENERKSLFQTNVCIHYLFSFQSYINLSFTIIYHPFRYINGNTSFLKCKQVDPVRRLVHPSWSVFISAKSFWNGSQR